MYLFLRSGCLLARSTSIPSNALRPSDAELGDHSNCAARGVTGKAPAVVPALASVSRSTIGVPTAARAREPMTTRRFGTVASFLVRATAGAPGCTGSGWILGDHRNPSIWGVLPMTPPGIDVGQLSGSGTSPISVPQ